MFVCFYRNVILFCAASRWGPTNTFRSCTGRSSLMRWGTCFVFVYGNTGRWPRCTASRDLPGLTKPGDSATRISKVFIKNDLYYILFDNANINFSPLLRFSKRPIFSIVFVRSRFLYLLIVFYLLQNVGCAALPQCISLFKCAITTGRIINAQRKIFPQYLRRNTELGLWITCLA